MLTDVENKLVKGILYYFTVFLIFFSWINHAFINAFNKINGFDILIIIHAIILGIVIGRKAFNFNEKMVTLLFLIIDVSYLAGVLYLGERMISPFFINASYVSGLYYKNDLLLLFILFLIVVVKVLPIKLPYFKKKRLIVRNTQDGLYQFASELNNKRTLLLIITFIPLAAFVEELVYRSILLSIILHYLHLDLVLSIFILSLVFGLVHLSSMKNFLFVISTIISAFIYFIALINLGLIVAWLLHLTTNVTALILFYPEIKKPLGIKSLETKAK